jgi:mTERF domain-containing protein
MEARYGGLNMLGHGDVSFPYLIESFPMLLLCSENNHLKPLIDFLQYIGIPKPRIASVLLSFPPIILSDVENDIKPRINAWEKVYLEDILCLSYLLEPAV